MSHFRSAFSERQYPNLASCKQFATDSDRSAFPSQRFPDQTARFYGLESGVEGFQKAVCCGWVSRS